MSRVNTDLGPIAAEELGLVAVHEHIGYGMPGSELDTQWWKTPEQRYAETVPKLRQFSAYSREYGGGTFVDATGICNGRDVDYYKSLSAKTGVHIVACTGFVGGDTALRFFAEAGVDYLMRQFVHEITVGIGSTGSRAGIIKVGVSRGFRMKELDLRIYRAAFVPVLFAVLVVAFSLQDRPRPLETTLAPDAFDGARDGESSC
jgi:phosphotriesterase-related protein